MKNELTKVITKALDNRLEELQKNFQTDILCIDAPIDYLTATLTRSCLEKMFASRNLQKHLVVFLTTNGGDANSTERIVNSLRHYYQQVDFLIPDHAYSAGTILCMSGNQIFMNYNSVLGPIDPQVMNKEGRFVPALGYLEKIEDLLNKAQTNTISQAEFLILKDFDLAELSGYEQARDLSIDLMKNWLVKYKYSNSLMSETEKINLAESIAKNLNDYRKWQSHGRPLNLETIQKLGLDVVDFGKDELLEKEIMNFHDLFEDYMAYQNTNAMIYSVGIEL